MKIKMIFFEKSSYNDAAAGSIGGVKGAKQSGAFILTLDSANAGGYFPAALQEERNQIRVCRQRKCGNYPEKYRPPPL